MSRIDDALRRLAGTGTEPRTPATLERFASEGRAPKAEESKKVTRVEDHKVASFVAPGPYPVEGRPAPARVTAHQPSPQPLEPIVDAHATLDEGKLVDVGLIADYVGFVARSVGRHRMLAAAAFLLVTAMTIAAVLLMPKTYYVQVKLLAQKNSVMTALSNPGRAVPWDADAPTRAAAETVLRRDNLISLITQTDLLNEWDRTRAPIIKLKDWVKALVLHTPTPDEKLDALVWRLETQMLVTTGPVGDGTVSIELYWPDGDMAFRLVEAAQQAFLEARQVAETSAISESIGILERYSASLHEDVNRTLTELQRSQSRGGGARVASAGAFTTARRQSVVASLPDLATSLGAPALDPSLEPDPELNRLRAEVSAKRAEIGRLEDARRRQIGELQSKLGTLKTVYTANHPSVLSAEQSLSAFRNESPQIAALKSELEELLTEYDDRAAAEVSQLIQSTLNRPAAADPVAPPPVVRAEPAPQPAPFAPPESPRNEIPDFASLRLRTELNQLQSVLERTDGARIELAVSQAAFKYRYSVITPAQIPRDPASPNLRLVIMAGLLASFVLAVGASVGTDLLSNRILEAWQLERQLGLPILGTARIA